MNLRICQFKTMESRLRKGLSSKLAGLSRSKSEPKKRERVLKPRTTCQKTEMEAVMMAKQKYRALEDWNRRLEHMNTILSAEEGLQLGKPLDDFETEFQLLRSESHKLRDLIMKRAGVIEKNGAKDKEAIILKKQIRDARERSETQIGTLKSQVRAKRKMYNAKELQNKNDRIQKLAENVRVLDQLFEDQNKEASAFAGMDAARATDMENQLLFRSSATAGGVLVQDDQFGGFHNIQDAEEKKEDSRELNEFEKQLLDEFKANDEEIDDMLDEVITRLQRIHLRAEDQEAAIEQQQKLIKRVNNQAAKAREGLNRQNHAIKDLLGKFRESNKLWKDIVLLIIFLLLVFANVKVLQWKGWLPG